MIWKQLETADISQTTLSLIFVELARLHKNKLQL